MRNHSRQAPEEWFAQAVGVLKEGVEVALDLRRVLGARGLNTEQERVFGQGSRSALVGRPLEDLPPGSA